MATKKVPQDKVEIKRVINPPKSEAIQPKAPTRKEEEPAEPRTRRSIITYKKEEKLENLYQLLGRIENTIEELSIIYADLPDSKHYGVGGKMKPTPKQEMIEKQLEDAQKRAERLLKIIEKLEK